MAHPRNFKKAKLENNDNDDGIFVDFHNDSCCLEKLKTALSWLDMKNNGLCLLKIKNCNANKGTSFSNAFCDVSRNVDDEDADKKGIFQFISVFKNGFQTIESYIQSPENLPESKGERLVLRRLLTFLKDDMKDCEKALHTCKDDEDKLTEADWTVTLAHHLLSRLSAYPDYALDSRRGETRNCPCCYRKISGTPSDTSIGDKRIWHGCVDIFLGTSSVPVKVCLAEEGRALTEDELPDEKESKANMAIFRQQIISEAIVFSFLKKKCVPDSENFLIPTIGIRNEKVFIYFYDSENDVLLESSPLALCPRGSLLKSTVLALWFAINYRYCCSGVPQPMKDLNYTADFAQHMESVYKIYKEDVDYGCGSAGSSEDPFKPLDYEDVPFYRCVDPFPSL